MFDRSPARQARYEALQEERRQRRDKKLDLKAYVKANPPIASYNGVHVYPDRIIRLPDIAGGMIGVVAECRPVAGVSASTEQDGAVSARSTLTRSMVPGMHGWQKKTDSRRGFLVIDGPDFQWQVAFTPQFNQGAGARKFAAAVTTAGRQAAPAASAAGAPDPLDQLRKLAELRDAGIVTAEEFEAKKAALLAAS